MSSTPPPPSQAERDAQAGRDRFQRPRYLVVALVGALTLGAACWTQGCDRLAFYRGDPEQGIAQHAFIRDDAERARVDDLYRRWVEAMDAARRRMIPLAAATFVLGAALLALASRGLGGRSNTRSALVQVIAAQAIVVCVTYFVTPEVQATESVWTTERDLIQQRQSPLRFLMDSQTPQQTRFLRRFTAPGWLFARTLGSALIIFALTRRSSREFFEAAAARGVADR